MGSAYGAAAERCQVQAQSLDKLTTKTAQGGLDVWDAVPMPAMAHVPADDARTLMAWLLAHTGE